MTEVKENVLTFQWVLLISIPAPKNGDALHKN